MCWPEGKQCGYFTTCICLSVCVQKLFQCIQFINVLCADCNIVMIVIVIGFGPNRVTEKHFVYVRLVY